MTSLEDQERFGTGRVDRDQELQLEEGFRTAQGTSAVKIINWTCRSFPGSSGMVKISALPSGWNQSWFGRGPGKELFNIQSFYSGNPMKREEGLSDGDHGD